MISPEIEQEIARLFHVEGWKPGTIATQLHVHYSTVRRVLMQEGVARENISRPSKLDPFVLFIEGQLKHFPKLTAARLFEMIKKRGYLGSYSHLRRLVTKLRPRPAPEAYFRLRALPGDEAQVDWGHFGHLEIGKAKRPLMAFVMVLSYSRSIFFTILSRTQHVLLSRRT